MQPPPPLLSPIARQQLQQQILDPIGVQISPKPRGALAGCGAHRLTLLQHTQDRDSQCGRVAGLDQRAGHAVLHQLG